MASRSAALVPIDHITRSIVVLRGKRIVLDRDPAAFYGVSTGRLNEAVKRNSERFPEDFVFRLSVGEHAVLLSQFAIPTPGRCGRRQLPWAFTEHGAIQAANVLNSQRAIAMSVYVVRAFVKLRELLASNKELARRLSELEARIERNIEKNSPRMIRRSPPCSRRSASSCARRHPRAARSASPPTSERRAETSAGTRDIGKQEPGA